MTMKSLAALVVGILMLATGASAAVIVDKTPDVGEWWYPLDGDGTYVYSNSFVFTGTSGTQATTLGAYMRSVGGAMGDLFRFELWGDNGNAPDPSNVLAVSGYLQTSNSTLQLVTAGLLTPYGLNNGTRYWVSLSTVGQQAGGESYQMGGHSQNSIYSDNGTFWYSNDPAGITFDGQALTPEMAIYVAGGETPIPEPATTVSIVAGLGLLALLRKRA